MWRTPFPGLGPELNKRRKETEKGINLSLLPDSRCVVIHQPLTPTAVTFPPR